MTITGVDYAFTTPSVSAMKQAGVSFACRYLSSDGAAGYHNPKDLTAAEVALLHGAGIGIVLNYESTATFTLGGYAAGVQIARWARAQAGSVGAPGSVPIYYSADFDASADQVATVLDFLHGAADAEGSKTRVGVYGSYAVAEAAGGAGFTYVWQTFAWSAGQWSGHAALRQTHVDQALGGAQVDYDEAVVADYGQWLAGAAPTPAPTGGTVVGVSDRPQLTQGATGAWVQMLQRSLMLAGCHPMGVDGNFGAHTLAAVQAAQGALHVRVDGQVGPVTWGALAARTGAVQGALNRHGAGLAVDGQAGPLTEAAVAAYQGAHGLAADGVVGAHTSAALGVAVVAP